jgi:hypothetical protein
MTSINELNDEQQAFLYYMQQRHGLTSPLFRSDMADYELTLARQLVEYGLLVENYVEESDSEDTTYYAAPRISSYYQEQVGPVLDYGQSAKYESYK